MDRSINKNIEKHSNLIVTSTLLSHIKLQLIPLFVTAVINYDKSAVINTREAILVRSRKLKLQISVLNKGLKTAVKPP